jgi:peptide/nickel transport system substrate-binding protein
MRARNSILVVALALGIGVGLPTISARAETVVRYAISMADIPLTTGQPDRGAGAYQFSAM